MTAAVAEVGSPANITASAQLAVGPGQLLGFFCSSTSGGTVKVQDTKAGPGGATLVNTFTPVAGQFYPLPFAFNNGVYVTIVGTIDVTFAFNAPA